MSLDRSKIYASESDFFTLGGSAIMKLTPSAAINVCKKSASMGLMVMRIEGGIFSPSGFEARLDCIWDSKINLPVNQKTAGKSNSLAVKFIELESGEHNAFIITIGSIGW